MNEDHAAAVTDVDVLVAGAGPAGLVAACLLARGGRSVLVVERERDFERAFRGEVLQPRYHAALRDVGLFEAVARAPHEELDAAHIFYGGRRVGRLDLRALDPAAGTTWWMRQPDLLGALHDEARRHPGYRLWFGAALQDLGGTTAVVQREGERCEVRARVVLGADGRFSRVRELGGFALAYDHHDVDVLWFDLPRPAGYDHVLAFHLGRSRDDNFLILPKHPDLLQCGLILPPGGYPALRAAGIDALRRRLRDAHPLFSEFAARLADFAPFHMLRGNRACVRQWARDGVLLIGDAAHTCSPAGGIGVAVAVETACVATGVVLDCLRRGDVSAAALGRVQAARRRQVRAVHRIQARFRAAVRCPDIARWVIPLLLGAAMLLRILLPLARRLLARRGSLPLFALDRGHLYPDHLTVGEGLDSHFARSGFSTETYTARWVRLPLWRWHVYLPNIKPRRDVVPLHDIDHVVGEYRTTWAGEMEIAGFELGCGVGRFWFGWIINLQGLWLGLLLFPRAFLQGFLRGRRSGSVYAQCVADAALHARTLGEVRDALPVAPRDGLRAGPADLLHLGGLALLSIAVHLPLLLPVAWFVWWMAAGA